MIIRRILYVVHRYAPYPGGSENYVCNMAEETARRGHDVAVFTGEHKGDRNGVRVSSDPAILHERWDLIVVHGGDVGIQNYVLDRADSLGGPVLYLVILPSNSPTCVGALHRARWIGCSTYADWKYLNAWNAQDRGVKVRHGICLEDSIGSKGFREAYNITTPYMFLSSGGYWPNKGFGQLVELFKKANRKDATLVLTGYDNRYGLMPEESEFIKPFLFEDRRDMLAALRASDLYILNSTSEGFGLVLLEAMLNYVPWVAREIAGAEYMREYGKTYTTPDQLLKYLVKYEVPSSVQLVSAQKYVVSTHLIIHTVNDILNVLG